MSLLKVNTIVLSLRLKSVSDYIQPCDTPVSWSYRSDSVDQSHFEVSIFFRKFEMKIGRFPLRLMSCRSDKIPYFHVMSYAFSKSKKTATTCSLFIYSLFRLL